MVQKLRSQAETLSGSPQPNFIGYQVTPIIAKRDPTTNDTGYALGQEWVNKIDNGVFFLSSVAGGSATWINASNPGGSIDSLTGDTGTATPSSNNIQISGTANQIITTASGSSLTISASSSFTSSGSLTATSGAITATNGNLVLGTAGNKLSIVTGSNASIGQSGAMTAGTITISTTAVTSSSLIFLTNASPGGTIGTLSVGTITAGTSFVINSSSSLDTSIVNWWIVN